MAAILDIFSNSSRYGGGGLADNFFRGRQEKKQNEKNEIITKMNAALGSLQNKNLPDSYKLKIANETYLPNLSKILGVNLPPVTQWGKSFEKSIEQINAIWNDPSIPDEEKPKAVYAVVGSSGDPQVASYVESVNKSSRERAEAEKPKRKKEAANEIINILTSLAEKGEKPTGLHAENLIRSKMKFRDAGGTSAEIEDMMSGLAGGGETKDNPSSLADDYARAALSDDPQERKFAEKMLEFKRGTVEEARSKELFKVSIKELPSLRDSAFAAQNSLSIIDEAIGLIDIGNVTGMAGLMRSKFAGMAESLGFSEDKVEQYSDAQYFRLLGRMITGPLRLEIIGPGPVTDFEQELLNKMGGGGSTAKSAAKRLLQRYMKTAKGKIEIYNNAVEGAGKLDPNVFVSFPSISSDDDVEAVNEFMNSK